MTGIDLDGRFAFVSASIPDPARWDGPYDPFAITDAVVAFARAVLSANGRLVTAAHPTIAPLLLFVGSELDVEDSGAERIVIYQSSAFADNLPEEIGQFEAAGVGTVIKTPAVNHEPGDPELARQSLELMRETMFAQCRPSIGFFVGGMGGIQTEWTMLAQSQPDASLYAIGAGGGAAADLVQGSPEGIRPLLAQSRLFPYVAEEILQHFVGPVG